MTITNIHSCSFIVYNNNERVNNKGHSLDFLWIQEKKVSYTWSEPRNGNYTYNDNINNNYETYILDQSTAILHCNEKDSFQ